ncbi:OmpA family protein [Sphingomonas crusticola]|uniref:OmpA family protein n=1 Tax=Sphingomonas crusticola TaxID=1697973 RepID=UPI000E28794D|nr:OmpA family protein [Sphingomonas crusticola]
MINLYKQTARALAASIVILAAGSPALAQPRPWDAGDDRADTRELVGMGVPLLRPALRDTPRGRAFVMRNFDVNDDGRINPREAEAANRAFGEMARSGRGGDWSRDRVVVRTESNGWDHRAMRNYRFRQTPLGATMTLQEDVLFRTDSAALRPGAIDKLRPLAGYLRANGGVRVAIIGHTDARGSDAHNQQLSERRAESVRAAFDQMGVVRARFRVEGHGEHEPVASNATPQGMRLNRRVEVTLLGQRADRFDRDN